MKTLSRIFICRDGSNRSAIVRCTTEAGLSYLFDVNGNLSDRRIVALLGRLVDYEQRGDQVKRRSRR